MLKLPRCLLSLRSLQQLYRSESTNAYSSKWVSPSLQQNLDKFSSSNPQSVPICLIGDPHLRRSNETVLNLQDGFVQASKLRLHLALTDFRRKNSFGRGISACQIGTNLRMIALNLGYGPLTLINPKIIWSSSDTITMWDDCMSIPRILVKKQRAKSISITYTDDHGNEQKWNELDVSVSELLQHEIDHLNGILNIDKPFIDDNNKIGKESIISMDEYNRRKNYFDEQVDYTIVPTV
jgi:peptide deformylase